MNYNLFNYILQIKYTIADETLFCDESVLDQILKRKVYKKNASFICMYINFVPRTNLCAYKPFKVTMKLYYCFNQ